MCDRSSKEKEVYRQPVAIILMTPKRAAPAQVGCAAKALRDYVPIGTLATLGNLFFNCNVFTRCKIPSIISLNRANCDFRARAKRWSA